MTTAPVLFLERPAFWTEPNDPESWFRALDRFASVAEAVAQIGTPRAVADRTLAGVIARRGAAGLFGPFQRNGRTVLPGVGLIAQDTEKRWQLTDEAFALLRQWQEDATSALERLAAYLVRESPWFRLLLVRLQRDEWELVGWGRLRSGRGRIQAGSSLLLREHAQPEEWFEDLEQQTAARWLARAGCDALAYDPEVLTRKKRKDDLSLSPMTAPLHLLESVGWLTRAGEMALPNEVAADLLGTATAAQALTEITNGRADAQGFVAAEPVLRELLATFGVSPDENAFARWMDALLGEAVSKGAVELLDAQPGQQRHGRGLNADPERKLVRWVVHTEFNDVFQAAWNTLERKGELAR